MPTDTERREVALRLRGLNDNISHVRRVYEAEGISILCEDQADYYQICYAVAGYLPAEHMHPCDYKELHERLADLIEPSGHECVPGECPLNVRHDNDRIDRDALLEEVKELKKCAWYFGLDFDADEPLRDRLKEASEDFAGCARRIREALGASDG